MTKNITKCWQSAAQQNVNVCFHGVALVVSHPMMSAKRGKEVLLHEEANLHSSTVTVQIKPDLPEDKDLGALG